MGPLPQSHWRSTDVEKAAKMGPLPQTQWRSVDVEKAVQRWDLCHRLTGDLL